MKKNTKKTWWRKHQRSMVIAGSFLAIVIVGTALVMTVVNKSNQAAETTNSNQPSTPTKKTCVGDECLSVTGLEYPAGQLPSGVSLAVKSALDDEYKAYSTYSSVITGLGSVRPFSMIIRAEESHIASLKAILDKYGEQIPANPYEGKLTAKSTRQENCQVGVDAEVANVALYRDDLLPKVTAYPDITSVFTNLMKASNDKHLPAFENCN